jgi:hypothetical protein
MNPSINPVGFTAVAFVNTTTHQIVIAYRGSVGAPLLSYDWTVPDRQIALGDRPPQFDDAEAFAESIQSDNPTYTILVTGHSLGAAEAEDVAAKLQVGGVTFAAPSVSNLLTHGTSTTAPGLTNYNISTDPVANDALRAGNHIGAVINLAPVEYLSNIFTSGILDIQSQLTGLGGSGSFIAGGIAALTQHYLYSYGQALLDAGYISSNPIQKPAIIFGDLEEIYPNIVDFVTVTDSSGNLTQSGKIIAGGSTVLVTETTSTADATTFNLTATSGANAVAQTAVISPTGQVTEDQITLDGTVISASPTDPADVNIAADGSILIGVPSTNPGDETTLIDAPDGTVSVMVGGDASTTAQTAVDFSPGGLTGDSITIQDAANGTPDITSVIPENDILEVASDDLLPGVLETFSFSGSSGTLRIDSPSSFIGKIIGLTPGNTIDLAGIGTATNAFLGDGNILYVNGASSSIALQLDPNQDFSGDGFVVSEDGQGGSDITVQSGGQYINNKDGTSEIIKWLPQLVPVTPTRRDHSA